MYPTGGQRGAGWSWMASLTWLVAGDWCWLVVGSFPPVSFFTFQKHSKRAKAEAVRPLQLTPSHFCHNLFIKTSHKTSPGEKGWKHRFNLWMEGAAKGDHITGREGFVAMRPPTTPASTVVVLSLSSLQNSKCASYLLLGPSLAQHRTLFMTSHYTYPSSDCFFCLMLFLRFVSIHHM